jgi:hypothetical protein
MAVVFCAIRWDAYYSRVVDSPAVHTEAALSDPAYQSRAPFFSTVLGTGLIRYDYNEASMTAEINAAAAGNIDCWAFLRYGGATVDSTIKDGLALYQANPNKGTTKWCSMDSPGNLGSTGNFATEVATRVAEMGQSHYQKVSGNRPLWYIYYIDTDVTNSWGGSNANFKAAIDAVRAGCVSAGLGTPYIVVFADAATKTALGCDAISNYIANIPTTLGGSYASMRTSVVSYWTGLAASSEMVPICQIGWSRAPRIRKPQRWERTTQRPYFGLRKAFDGTISEIAAHVAEAVAFVDAHPTECPQRVILAYAWNEHDEGGWLCPTLGDPPTALQPGGARLAALAPVLA